MNEEIKRLLAKADHALEVAHKLLEQGFVPDAASKIYYAMFYATQALLINEGIEVSKHSAVESAFGFHFIKTGKIDPKYHKILIGSRKIREVADYDTTHEVVEAEVDIKIEEGSEFIKIIKTSLGL